MRHAIATAVLAAVALLLYWLSVSLHDDASGETSTYASESTGKSNVGAVDNAHTVRTDVDAGVATAPPLQLPRSLRGTEIDGGLTVNEEGEFVPDALAVRLFDYLLSGEGEMSHAEMRAALEQIARGQVPADQVDRVLALFDEYLRYRSEAQRVSRRFGSDEVRDYHNELVALQQKTFGADAAERMFGRSNMLAEDTIARREVYADKSLSPEERASKIADLDAKLPDSIRQTRKRITQPRRVRQVVEQMRADGVGEEEIDAYRADEFGAEAAARLRALDEKRAVWQARLDAYRNERDAIRARGLGEAATETAIQELREAHFEGTEIRRVRVLDQMASP